jgi:2-oxoglutarate dehydrogenase E2 component (dihydrolipoamide succinyltransferase)
MIIEMKVPSPGESITEVQIARWLKSNGDYVEKDEELCEIDSDKATLTLNAESEGILKIITQEGQMIAVGEVVCTIDTSAKRPAGKKKEESEPVRETASNPTEEKKVTESKETGYADKHPSVAARKLMDEGGISPEQVTATGKGGRITKGDVLNASIPGMTAGKNKSMSRDQERVKMTMLRKKIAQRLVAVKNETAMLTTFNEVDMSQVMEIRKKFKDKFKEKHQVGLGFMSFFTKAVTGALMAYPSVNGMIDGDEIVFSEYADVGIAVSTPKGLMVPVIRNAESKSLADIERDIEVLAKKAREGKISLGDMTGGTFTITNGGVFGSLLSTPIINPPQSAILGMHNIVERPVAINGKVEIRPMMYVALSYDHRIIDGRESVGFLIRVKQLIEDPVQMLFGGKDPMNTLLGL